MPKAEPVAAKAPETRNDKLHRLLVKALPDQKDAVASGQWGPKGAPYEFLTLPSGKVRLTISNRETGDRVGVVGTDRDDVLTQLEARLSQ